MPSLIANYQDRETVTKLKKFYSVMSQAYLLIEAEEGPFGSWTSNKNHDGADSVIMGEKFAPYLKVIKTCAPGESGCWAPGMYKMLKGTNWVNMYNGSGYIYRAVLADGIAISMYQYADADVKRMVLDVDVNGAKPPNQLGKDTFRFSTTATAVVPSCTGKDAAEIDADLMTPGVGECVALWVITHENMDYLRCPEQLSWGGKTKCD
jgi:hypothetical protein